MANGYSNAIILKRFPELTDDPEHDPCWVVFRNPRMMPRGELGNDVPVDPVTGKVLDPKLAETAMFERLSKVIIAMRCYDGTPITADEVIIDPFTGEVGDTVDRKLLIPPYTPDVLRRLPLAVIDDFAEAFTEALNPKARSTGDTSTTSTSPPSPPTTEPGPQVNSPPNSPTSN